MDLASNMDQVLQQSIEGLGGGGGGRRSSSAEFSISSFIRSLSQIFPSLQIPVISCPSSQPCSPGLGVSLLSAPELGAGLEELLIPALGLERCCSAIFRREGLS